MPEDKNEDLLKRAHETRGFHLGVHEIMNAADPEYMEHYQQWLEFTNLKDRHLDMKTKEIVHVAVHVARQTDPDHIKAHMLAAVKAGATKEELFEVSEMGFLLGGTTKAWRRARRCCLVWKPGVHSALTCVAHTISLKISLTTTINGL